MKRQNESASGSGCDPLQIPSLEDLRTWMRNNETDGKGWMGTLGLFRWRYK